MIVSIVVLVIACITFFSLYIHYRNEFRRMKGMYISEERSHHAMASRYFNAATELELTRNKTEKMGAELDRITYLFKMVTGKEPEETPQSEIVTAELVDETILDWIGKK